MRSNKDPTQPKQKKKVQEGLAKHTNQVGEGEYWTRRQGWDVVPGKPMMCHVASAVAASPEPKEMVG